MEADNGNKDERHGVVNLGRSRGYTGFFFFISNIAELLDLDAFPGDNKEAKFFKKCLRAAYYLNFRRGDKIQVREMQYYTTRSSSGKNRSGCGGR